MIKELNESIDIEKKEKDLNLSENFFVELEDRVELWCFIYCSTFCICYD